MQLFHMVSTDEAQSKKQQSRVRNSFSAQLPLDNVTFP